MPISKFIRVAMSGQTIDGREITPAQIDQMAATYNPKKYGARVNLEHYLSFFPGSAFKAYGDVLALKAEPAEDGQRALLAQIDCSADLVKLKNEDKEKVFWSIEMAPNFAGTGQAYMTGLAATDNPASLGTEMLKFAVQSDKAPDSIKAKLFSVSVESALELEEDPAPGILDKVKAMFAGQSRQAESISAKVDERFGQTEAAITEVAAKLAEVQTKLSGLADSATVKSVADDLKSLTTKLSHTPDKPQRPPASGADANQTDC